MFAKVIVDVPAKQTNRPFDYTVPDSLSPWIEVGSRVGVPFGPRILQGFVVGLSDRTDLSPKKLKPVDHVMDLYPPLTPELVELAHWMSRTYLCHELSALQAMVPAALKAKYERYITVNEEEDANPWHVTVSGQDEIVRYIKEKGSVPLDSLLQRFPQESMWIKEQIRSGVLNESQTIKNRVSKKKALTLFPPEPVSQLEVYRELVPPNAKRQREVLDFLLQNPEPIRLTEVMLKLNVGAGTVKGLADKGWVELKEVEVLRDPYAQRNFPRTSPLPLTEEQKRVFEPVRQAVIDSKHEVFLLHGVTGSGKTEVYLQAIQQCLDLGKEAIVLVPEIALTPQMVERFKGRFGDEVAVLHSRLSTGERFDEWRKISMKQVRVVIGARSAIFAPFTKLGLIIIDEEHESSYKQEESPKYHAREVAIERAKAHGASVLLGSATPSLESFYRTLEKEPVAAGASAASRFASSWASSPVPRQGSFFEEEEPPPEPEKPFTLLTMRQRVQNRPLPPVRIVDMRDELKDGNRSMFSRPLHAAIAERLRRKEQSVLLLNRRGYSTFVMCRTCGYTLQCPHCDIALTYHQSTRMVRCHYCGHAERQVTSCPSCDSDHIRYFGTGTQRVEEELGKLFPGIRVIRMDVDTTSEKGSHEKWLTMFRERKADVLLGTQMVAKGLDFPDVTLVGVIAADTVLNLPDFRAGERTFQLLTQVAGRAGRHQLPGEVYVQTYTPEHYSIINAAQHDYDGFIRTELETRLACGYPPYCRLILLTLSHEEIPFLVRASESLAKRLKDLAGQAGLLVSALSESGGAEGMEVLGPVASPIPRIKDRYRFRCMVKYKGGREVSELVGKAVAAFDEMCRQEGLQISVDVDPQLLM
ncbi:primosomal protein N' [Paenibacillus aurantius]|uniref:Replication restart protein PriA n=1 Tax=Paenibacillus aurantius TaxID=2918900 RepID=A0AA96LIL1_9BACL|nr:primosomal protein N' [Paenibacillus aurantius]WNQ13668.1 primosomal protein N' [Paenibacillus aurantius]